MRWLSVGAELVAERNAYSEVCPEDVGRPSRPHDEFWASYFNCSITRNLPIFFLKQLRIRNLASAWMHDLLGMHLIPDIRRTIWAKLH